MSTKNRKRNSSIAKAIWKWSKVAAIFGDQIRFRFDEMIVYISVTFACGISNIMKDLKIFLSSPGDCNAEREAVHGVVTSLNDDPIVASFAKIQVVAWDWNHGVPLEAHLSPQTSVNAFLPVPEACEIYVGIFRCRFGSPLPEREYRKLDGSFFLSGSEYEFHRAWDARRRGASFPHLLVYRQGDTEPCICPDAEQKERLDRFFAQPPFLENGQWSGSFTKFANTQDFVEKLDQHLRQLISQWHPSARLPLEEWMRRQAKRFTLDAGPRYMADAHVESEIGQVFDWLLGVCAAEAPHR